jgi:ferric-dicitrate binding protein FerR (iron transport regulator)
MVEHRDQRDASREEGWVRRLLETAGPRPEIPEDDLREIAAAARSAWVAKVGDRRPTPRRRFPVTLAAGLAAALLVALGLAWWLAAGDRGAPAIVAEVEAVRGPVRVLVPTGEGGEGRPLAAGEGVPFGATVETGAGDSPGRASFRLSGGAVVRLDAGTRLRLAALSLLDLERGGVYVDTGAGGRGGETLAVRTPWGTARDVGTRFAVRVAGDVPGLQVRVRGGAVVVERDGRSYLASAGEELVVHPDGRLERSAAPPFGPEWEWVMEAAPGFEVEGRRLGEFLDWVAGETGWRIAFADEELAATVDEIVLHGSIGGLRPDEAPFVILPGAGLSGSLEEGTLLIRRRGPAGPQAR